jgi:putative SOS response-associated peptidase YedK
MCFHTKQTKLALEVQSRFNAIIDNPVEFKPCLHINGFEFPKTSVIMDEKPNIISHFNWGLIPSWAKDEEIKKYTLNAKIETVHEKPSFKDSIDKRCLIIANGYFEWQWLDPKGKVKQKYELRLPNEELFAFAGLYSNWINKSNGVLKETYTILTTDANPLLSEIHNHKKRMPIVLKREDEAKWLNHEPIEQFAFPYTADLIALKL